MSSSARFRINFTRQVAVQYSDDRSTQTGALIVPADGGFIASANTLPRNVNGLLDARHERPVKYAWIEHAERNVIYRCAQRGTSTAGAKMYLAHPPCADCARAIIQAGIKELYLPVGVKWGGDGDKCWNFNVAERMFAEAGVKVVEVVE